MSHVNSWDSQKYEIWEEIKIKRQFIFLFLLLLYVALHINKGKHSPGRSEKTKWKKDEA